jgi:hypothetical protein
MVVVVEGWGKGEGLCPVGQNVKLSALQNVKEWQRQEGTASSSEATGRSFRFRLDELGDTSGRKDFIG